MILCILHQNNIFNLFLGQFVSHLSYESVVFVCFSLSAAEKMSNFLAVRAVLCYHIVCDRVFQVDLAEQSIYNI